MSGKYTVAFVKSLLGKGVCSSQDKLILQSINLLDQKEQGIIPNVKKISLLESKFDNYTILINDKGEYKFQLMGGPEKTVEELKEKEVERPTSSAINDRDFSPDAVKEIIEGRSLTLDQEKIRKVLENYVKGLPRTAESYKSGEILIRCFDSVDITISSLLSAGTKVLDAILYVAYQDSEHHKFIFSVEILKPTKISEKEMVENIDLGNKAIKAAFCLTYNQGGLPNKGSENKVLSKFIRETIFKKKNMNSDKLCDILSSSDPSFFPSEVFLKISLDNVPSDVSSRCKMSIAGNKAVRYAMLSQRFEKDEVAQPATTEGKALSEFMTRQTNILKARSIVDVLCSIGSNFEAQKRMHPLSSERPSRKNFTLQLTCAIITSLSPTGRSEMRNFIDEKKIESFKRDENIYGVVNTMEVVRFPILENNDANFSELSVEAVKAAYGLV